MAKFGEQSGPWGFCYPTDITAFDSPHSLTPWSISVKTDLHIFGCLCLELRGNVSMVIEGVALLRRLGRISTNSMSTVERRRILRVRLGLLPAPYELDHRRFKPRHGESSNRYAKAEDIMRRRLCNIKQDSIGCLTSYSGNHIMFSCSHVPPHQLCILYISLKPTKLCFRILIF